MNEKDLVKINEYKKIYYDAFIEWNQSVKNIIIDKEYKTEEE